MIRRYRRPHRTRAPECSGSPAGGAVGDALLGPESPKQLGWQGCSAQQNGHEDALMFKGGDPHRLAAIGPEGEFHASCCLDIEGGGAYTACSGALGRLPGGGRTRP